MRKGGYNLGGEQTGHFVISDYTTTGDALIAALQVLAILQESQKPASEVIRLYEPTPQILKNVRFNGHNPLEQEAIKNYLEMMHKELEGKGRLLVRKSGTEKLIRVMAEGEDSDQVEGWVDSICDQLTAVV
jgi:phosphoglucosamine mutase